MKIANLERTYFGDRTEGILRLPKTLSLATLELPWRDNARNLSCIPEGTYIVRVDRQGKHQWWTIQDVMGRTFIEIHPANHADELAGCIAPALSIKQGVAQNSIEACKTIERWSGEYSFLLNITG